MFHQLIFAMTIELNSLLKVTESGLYTSLPARRRIGLSFSKGLVSLCLTDVKDEKILAFEHWNCVDSGFPELLEDQLSALLALHPWLSDAENDFVIGIDVPKFALVPATFYDTAKKESYLNLQHPLEKSGEWALQDALESYDAFMVYALPLRVENRLRAAFPNAQVRHAKTILLEQLLLLVNARPAPELALINVEKDSFDLIIFKAGKLFFFNTFSYQTVSDLVYFTLLALEDSNLYPESLVLELCGAYANEAELKQGLAPFVPNLINLELPAHAKMATAFQKVSLHNMFPLIASV